MTLDIFADGLSSLVAGGPPYSDQLRDRSALAFSLGSLYPPPPSDLYLSPPVSSPHLFTPRPEVSPGLTRSRDRDQPGAGRAGSPKGRPGQPHNNSVLSDKLRLGFAADRPPASAEGSIKKESGAGALHEGFRKPPGPLAVSQATFTSPSSSSLVSTSSHSGQLKCLSNIHVMSSD